MSLSVPVEPRFTPTRDSLIFISDLHLDPAQPRRVEAFGHFLSELVRQPCPAGLFVLGDLFDVWSGKGSLKDPGYLQVLSSLRALSDAGVALTIVKGNRDHLLEARFARMAGALLVEDGLSIQMGQRRAYLCHGDHLIKEDRPHQRLRAILRGCVVQTLAAELPSRWVSGVAWWLRGTCKARSRRHGPNRPAGISPREAARIFRGGNDILITGHVHEERQRSLTVDGRECELYTLGDWEEWGSILEYDGRDLRFHKVPFLARERSEPVEIVRCPDESS